MDSHDQIHECDGNGNYGSCCLAENEHRTPSGGMTHSDFSATLKYEKKNI